jgi:hypothetical protein
MAYRVNSASYSPEAADISAFRKDIIIIILQNDILYKDMRTD